MSKKVVFLMAVLVLLVALLAGCDDPQVNGVKCIGEATRCAYEVYKNVKTNGVTETTNVISGILVVLAVLALGVLAFGRKPADKVVVKIQSDVNYRYGGSGNSNPGRSRRSKTW